MIYCPLCGHKFELRDRPEASNDDFGIVRMPDDRQLLRAAHYQHLAKRLADLPVSSREVPNWIADTIWTFPGTILAADGTPFELEPEGVDAAFGEDGSFRWIRSFRAHADQPLKQSPQTRLLARLRLIDLAFRIADFDAASHG